MDEFNNRMDAQRDILEVINRQGNYTEELCGLSKSAIDRWIYSNYLNPMDEICKILFQIAHKLFFLANKRNIKTKLFFPNKANIRKLYLRNGKIIIGCLLTVISN